MATTTPLAYNPSASPISGTTQVGSLAVGTTEQDYSISPGGVTWWNGPDEDLGYVIAQAVPDNSQPTNVSGQTASVGFFRTDGFLENNFIELSELISSGQTFNTGNEAYLWLSGNGYWSSWNFVAPTATPTPTPTSTPTPTPTTTPTPTPTSTSTPIGPVTTNNVLYYDPSNISSYPGSGTTINDLSGNGRNGTMSNISFTSPYFTYNGTSSQVTIADNALLEPGSGSWTMEVWVNQSVSGGDVVLGKFDNGGLAQDVSYSIRTTGTAYYSQIGSGSGSGPTLYVNSTTYTGTLNTWYQIVYVFKNGATKTLETFVNGTSVGSVNHSLSSILNTNNSIYLGSYNGGEYSQWFDGKIGITRLYNTSLTSAEVLQNFNADKSKYGL
jgi:hypothetical protein